VAEPRRIGAMVRIAGISDFGWVAHIVVADPHTVEIRLAGANSTAGTSASRTGPKRIDRQIGLTVRALLVQTQP
jgi:hypothetical protein